MKITFLGAAQEVTGSKYLIEHEKTKILVDCGLLQGEQDFTKRNWESFPIEPKNIEAVVLTHAHIDHTGYIPVLVQKGFKGKIYCSQATYGLAALLLKDSAFIQEDDAKKASSSGHATVPLYTQKDAEKALTLFQTVDYDTVFPVGSLTVKLIQSFHILGSSFIVISDGKKTLTFSGDLGRPNQLIMKSPAHITQTDFLVLESTYGDKLHGQDDPMEKLGEMINTAIAKQGIIIIPCFAVERTQTILYCLYQLRQKNIIPEIPIFLDSPLAIKVTELFTVFKDEHKLSSELWKQVSDVALDISTIQESKRLDHLNGPAIIISGSGMADGGRVVSHLTHFISNPKNTVIFVGFQAKGTHGYDLVHGAEQIDIYGKTYAVGATIKIIHNLSAHADYNEILQWLSFLQTSPKKVFLTHGEPESSESLKKKIEDRFGWFVVIPKRLDSFDLD